MTRFRLATRGLRHHRVAWLLTSLCLGVAGSVIVGSMVVGDSFQTKLRTDAESALGNAREALVSPNLFRAALAGPGEQAVLDLEATASNPDGAFVPGISLRGEDGTAPGKCILAERVARELKAKVGDLVFLDVPKPDSAGGGTVFARKKLDETTVGLRVKVAAIAPRDQSILPLASSTPPRRWAKVNREWLATQLNAKGLANAIVSSNPLPERQWTEADYGLVLTPSSQGVILHSKRLVIPPAIAQKAPQADRISTALAISVERGLQPASRKPDFSPAKPSTQPKQAIHYALIASDAHLKEGEITLNVWAAQDLGLWLEGHVRTLARPGGRGQGEGGRLTQRPGRTEPSPPTPSPVTNHTGEGVRIEITTLVAKPDGTFDNLQTLFDVKEILPMSGMGADSAIPPDFEGMTNADKISDWNPPFPVDLKLVTPRDEAYWKLYRAAPKAFVSPEAMREMWQGMDVCTGIRFRSQADAERFVGNIKPQDVGVRVLNVREQALKAAKGASDLSGLLMMLGAFLIVAAATVAGSVTGLMVRRRASEWALRKALGDSPRAILGSILLEATIPILVGSGVAIAGGIGFAVYAIRPLGSMWQDLSIPLVLKPEILVGGVISSVVIGYISIAWALRGVGKANPLLALRGGSEVAGFRRADPVLIVVALVVFFLGVAGVFLAPSAETRFGLGFLGLVACLWAIWLTLGGASPMRGKSIGFALARGRRRAIVLQVGLLASATFVVGAVSKGAGTTDPAVGTGRFDLIATTTVPLAAGFDSAEGRRKLGFALEDEPIFVGMRTFGARRTAGDDASCLNPSMPVSPRVLGLGAGVLPRFSTGHALPEGKNPISATADSETVQWVIGSGAGKTFAFPGLTVRFQDLLPQTVLCGYVVIAQNDFERQFPTIHDPSLFLIETPQPEKVAQALRRNLGRAGVEVRETKKVMADLNAAKAVYVSMFAALGSMGLIFAAFGTAAITLRNAFDRRRELALLTALGFSEKRLRLLVVYEAALASFAGVVLGALCAGAPLYSLMLGVTEISFLVATAAARFGSVPNMVHALRSE